MNRLYGMLPFTDIDEGTPAFVEASMIKAFYQLSAEKTTSIIQLRDGTEIQAKETPEELALIYARITQLGAGYP